MSDPLFEQANPLIDECSAETLANVQSMLARIQILKIDKTKTLSAFNEQRHHRHYDSPCPANELYTRLLLLVRDALDYEINKIQQRHTKKN
ncbi:MAG: hypothetical protein ACRBBR_04810 [Cellvibrionaceae bacterium]